jgi:uncharacterized protein
VRICILLFTVLLVTCEPAGAQTPPVMPDQQIILFDAVIAGDTAAAIDAIKTGANVNALDTRPNIAGPNGRRSLNYAAIRNDTAMITELLNNGANINLANRTGFTPLHHAAEAGSKEAVTLLIAKGANITLRNVRDQTAEETATATNHPDIAKILHQARQ